MIPSRAPSPLGLFSVVAPRKRQYKRSTVPESDGIFMPKIRPDFGCQSPQCRGWRDACSARPRAALVRGFLAPPAPAPRRFALELIGDCTHD